jgi:hypothetical protein
VNLCTAHRPLIRVFGLQTLHTQQFSKAAMSLKAIMLIVSLAIAGAALSACSTSVCKVFDHIDHTNDCA